MHIRDYQWSDISCVVDIYCDAFENTLSTARRLPHRAQYPLALRAYVSERQRSKLSSSTSFGFVCVADVEDVPMLQRGNSTPVEIGTILGFAWWRRDGVNTSEDPWTRGRHASSFYKVERALQRLENLYLTHVNPNPAEARQVTEQPADARNSLQRFAVLKDTAHWHLNNLAVDPNFQNRGIGRMLLSWAMEKFSIGSAVIGEADTTSNEPIMTLVATPEGMHLYEKLGFEVLWDSDGGDIPMNLPGPQEYAMIRDPSQAWTEQLYEPSCGQAEQLRGFVRWKYLAKCEIAQISPFNINQA